MLSKIRLRNFKSHKDTCIDLGNLTLLTGVNSSGKSSLIHALLLLRQTFLKGRLDGGLDLNAPLCKIGTGQEALYRLADSNLLSIDLVDEEAFSFEYAVEAALGGTYLPKSRYSDNVERETLSRHSLFNVNFQYVSSLRFGGKSHFDQYDYEVGELHQVSKSLGQGECVAHYLDRYGADSSANYLFDGREYALADQVELWTRRISEGLTVEVQKDLKGGFDVVYGYVYDGMKPLTGLKAENIGYGISHSLPVVVALLSAKPGSLVILENPEAHLHPKGQAEVAKLISRVAQNGVQVIVETHSDHIVNGVLVAAKRFESDKEDERIRGLDREKVKIYYVDKDPDVPAAAKAKDVKVEAGGRLDFQPPGFFDQAEKDLCSLMGV